MKKLLIGLILGLLIGTVVGAKAATPITDSQLLDGIKNLFLQAGWTPPSTSPPPPPAPPPPSTKPSDITGLLWTVMAPFNKPGATNSPENLYISRAETDSRYTPYMFLQNGGLVFKTFVDGVHSANSDYPRSEMREMKDTNWNEASWSNKSGTHTLTIRQAISHEPVVKPEVVAAQIHDGSDDIMQVFLQGSKLYIRYNDDNSLALMDDNYVLGTPYDLQIVASGSHIKTYYNGALKLDNSKSGSGWYFKAGSYCQSNPSKGDSPLAYCEVVIYSVKVTHS